MAARRLIMVMLLLLFVSSLAAALAPDRPDDEESSTESTTIADEAPRGKSIERTIRVDAKLPKEIEIEVGTQLALTVTADEPDQVEIQGLGELEDVDADGPARFNLLPLRAGSHPIRLVETNERIGSIEVREPKPDASEEDPSAEPPPPEPSERPANAQEAGLIPD